MGRLIAQERAVIHGWPWAYLWRTPQPWWDDPKASPTFAWDIRDAIKQFRLFPLFADIGACAIGVAVVVAIWEWRRRRCNNRLQFSLRSLLLFVTLVAIGLGWWGLQRDADRQLSDHLKFLNENPIESSEPVPRFPLWARVAIGDEHLLPLGLSDLGLISVNWTPDRKPDIKYLVDHFPKKVVVYLNDTYQDDSDVFEIIAFRNLVVGEASGRFFERIETLRNLNYVGASTIDAHALICLSRNESLKDIALSYSRKIDDNSWSQFVTSSNVVALRLRKMRLTDVSLAQIARLKRLRELDITNSPISDRGLASLAVNKHIVELSLVETLITDDGLVDLASIPTLDWLDLRETAVTDAGVSSLKESLHSLEVKYDSEGPDLAYLTAKFDAVRRGQTAYFSVAGWKIQDRHLWQLGYLKRIESLALNAHHLTDATLTRVESLRDLEQLDVSSSLITGRGLRHLMKLPKLRTLTLDDRQIDDEAINALKQLPALKDLWIKCDLGDADLKRLEARMNAAFAKNPTVKRHFDRHSESHSPWD